ncbi:MAG: hypothetical protein ACO1SV_09195 [Fimbriimonas sp.]
MRLPTWIEIRDGFRRYANPLYHLRKLREDLHAMWHALRTHRQVGERTLTQAELAESFRGKMMACFFMAGPTSWIGIGLAYWLQRKFENPWLGQYAVHPINMVITTAAYQLFWWFGNRDVYRAESPTGGGQFRAMERDLLPLHWGGIRIGMTFNLFTWPLTSLILYGIHLWNQRAAVGIPAQFVQQAVDACLVHPTFTRLMGDFFERWSNELGRRHAENLAMK